MAKERVKLPKLEGLKWPTKESVWTGLTANHFKWIYEPVSILLIALSYYSHKYFYDNREAFGLSEKWAFSIACWVPGLLGFWFFGFAFLALDYFTKEEGKLYKQRTTVPVRKMLPILLRNHFLHLAICPFLTIKLFDWAQIEPRAPEEETFINIFISCVLCGLAFEVTFFFCHYLEHMFPSVYRNCHLLHHTTKADIALSGYYMTVIDYFGEGPIPMMMQLLPTIFFRSSSTAVIHGIYLNILYATTVHSGWRVPGVSHPGMHWLHHNHITKVGEAINYATHFDLMDLLWNTKSYKYLEVEKQLNEERAAQKQK